MSVFRPIHHVFAPHADARHCGLALSLVFRPWTWRNGPSASMLRTEISDRLGGDVALFSSGRESLRALFHALHISHGDDVIVQAYTCVVVVNAIRAAGATPVYVDIEKATLGMDPHELRNLFGPRVKAVVCQHTFGIPCRLREIKAICEENHVPLIEDCAHMIPDESGPDEIGLIGEFALLSFGRDKAVSGVSGGAIVSRRDDVTHRLRKLEHAAADLSLFRIRSYLLYPLLYAMAKPFYGLWLGKAFLKAMAMIRALPMIVTPEERKGIQSQELHKLPNACAALALQGMKRLKEINDHRRELTRYYLEACAEHGWGVIHGIRADLPLQKFPLFFPHATAIRNALKSKNIHLKDGWTGCVICPETVDASSVGYDDGQDPNAEECGEQILSLPTHPTMTLNDAKYLTEELGRIV